MIFDEAYDTALWFIVRADKKNRKEIINRFAVPFWNHKILHEATMKYKKEFGHAGIQSIRR